MDLYLLRHLLFKIHVHGIYWWVSLGTTDGDETAVIIVDVNSFHQ